MHNYKNPHCCTMEDFNEDLNRITHILRLINRYKRCAIFKEKLIINHLILFCNAFGLEAGNRMLFFKIEKEHWPVLKTCLVFLDYLQEIVSNVRGETIHTVGIQLDQNVVNILRDVGKNQ